mgnify:CR=1 FL=1
MLQGGGVLRKGRQRQRNAGSGGADGLGGAWLRAVLAGVRGAAWCCQNRSLTRSGDGRWVALREADSQSDTEQDYEGQPDEPINQHRWSTKVAYIVILNQYLAKARGTRSKFRHWVFRVIILRPR